MVQSLILLQGYRSRKSIDTERLYERRLQHSKWASLQLTHTSWSVLCFIIIITISIYIAVKHHKAQIVWSFRKLKMRFGICPSLLNKHAKPPPPSSIHSGQHSTTQHTPSLPSILYSGLSCHKPSKLYRPNCRLGGLRFAFPEITQLRVGHGKPRTCRILVEEIDSVDRNLFSEITQPGCDRQSVRNGCYQVG